MMIKAFFSSNKSKCSSTGSFCRHSVNGARRFAIVIFLISVSFRAVAQQPPKQEPDLERLTEELFAIQDGDIDANELFETLLLYYSHPIDLNKTDAAELQSLLILSPGQVAALLDYIAERGPMLSLYELQTIPLLDMAVINRLLPFVTVSDRQYGTDGSHLAERIFREKNNYLIVRYSRTLEDKKGYRKAADSLPPAYAGDPGHYYARFRVSHGKDFSLGFTAEKDAGEQFIWDRQTHRYGADFYSAHFQIQDRGRLKNLIVGDYQMQYGQGLVFGAGFPLGKGAETITTARRANLGIRPYTSAYEANFFRGIAATCGIAGQVELSAFYSGLGRDGSVDADDLSFVSSVILSGFHRTENEIMRKGNITERNYGGNLTYRSNDRSLTLGASMIGTRWSRPLRRADRLTNRFEFSGDRHYVASVFGDWNWQNFSLFGEAATSASGGIGMVGGVLGALGTKVETAILLRNYQKDFHTFYGNSFGESTRNINEAGWYWGLKYSPARRWQVAAYFDSFQFPWVRWRTGSPSSGYEYLARATYRPHKSLTVYAQFREESKPVNPAGEEQEAVVRYPTDGVKRNYLLNIDYPASETISLKTRLQWSAYDFNGTLTRGYAVGQDLNVSMGKFKVSGRFSIFDTDNFSNSQFAYERDVQYVFFIANYNGVGTRKYIVMKYSPTRKWSLWIKYARYHFRDRDEISSSHETISGNIRTDVRLQVRVKF